MDKPKRRRQQTSRDCRGRVLSGLLSWHSLVMAHSGGGAYFSSAGIKR
jgi:hypothetical protein